MKCKIPREHKQLSRHWSQAAYERQVILRKFEKPGKTSRIVNKFNKLKTFIYGRMKTRLNGCHVKTLPIQEKKYGILDKTR